MVFDSWTAEGVGVGPLNVRALEVLAPFAVAFSRSAVPPRLVSSVPLCVWLELSVGWWVGKCIPLPDLRSSSVV